MNKCVDAMNFAAFRAKKIVSFEENNIKVYFY